MASSDQQGPYREDQSFAKAETTYFLDQENIAEMARIQLQSRLMTEGMGGILPEFDNQFPKTYRRVIDLCCGTGDWAWQVAQEYAAIEVVGLDCSEGMLAYARETAREKQIENVHFLAGNVLLPLPFPDNSFDMVNARFLIGALRRQQWPVFMRECVRILRPGGMLRLTEGDRAGWTNKAGCEQIATWAVAFFLGSQYGFGNDRDSVGLTAILPSLLEQAGCEQISKYVYELDFSYGTDLYESQCQNWRIAYVQIQPRLVKLGIATDAEFEAAYQQMLDEIAEPDFQGATRLMTAIGYKAR